MVDALIEFLFAWGFQSKSLPSWIVPLALAAMCLAIAVNANAADRIDLVVIFAGLAAVSMATKVYYVCRRLDPE